MCLIWSAKIDKINDHIKMDGKCKTSTNKPSSSLLVYGHSAAAIFTDDETSCWIGWIGEKTVAVVVVVVVAAAAVVAVSIQPSIRSIVDSSKRSGVRAGHRRRKRWSASIASFAAARCRTC